jgi:hypothetical protein
MADPLRTIGAILTEIATDFQLERERGPFSTTLLLQDYSRLNAKLNLRQTISSTTGSECKHVEL